MDEKDGRLSGQFARLNLAAEKHTRKRGNPGTRFRAAQSHVLRHHGALRKSDKRKARFIEAGLRELGVKESVEDRGCTAHPVASGLPAVILKTEPLPSSGCRVAGVGSAWRDESRAWMALSKLRRQGEQIVAVSPQAMQQNDQRGRGLAGCRQ